MQIAYFRVVKCVDYTNTPGIPFVFQLPVQQLQSTDRYRTTSMCSVITVATALVSKEYPRAMTS